ncbi:NADP-dependent oxidoreductase domain-containing protein [Pholiota molesta]|nr:NADP-dependent oxidoreductase domain-containing protein [Pholiota molesta]
MSNAAGNATLPTHFTLPSGDRIPSVALGVWRAGPGQVGPAVKTALNVGYRHIDGAWIYGNEAEVGEAIKASGIPRSDIWLTSKLWNTFHQPNDVEPALDDSLSKLGTDYLDLYLMHWPVAFKNNGKEIDVDFELTENPYPTWKKLEEMVEKGKVRNIGISNFNIRRIQNLTANPLKIKPAVNQVELSYWNPQPELVKWAKENGLLLEAYSPLGSEGKVKESLQIPEVQKIAKELGITPAQVYISWHVQRGTVVLPKSVTPSRIEENFKVVALPPAAFELIEKVATSHEPLRTVDPSKRWGVDIWS